MKILIIDTYYEFFLREFYSKRRGELEGLNYSVHRDRLMKHRFSSSDAMSYFFRKEGWEAEEVVFNDNELQAKWARENGVAAFRLPGIVAKGVNFLFGVDWRFGVLKEQVRRLKPDIIYIKEQSLLTDAMVGELKDMTRLIAMQVGSRLLKRRTYQHIDLVFTSFPHFVSMFEKRGLRASYLRICFDSRVAQEIKRQPLLHEVTFVGGITFGQHRTRNEILETASREFPLKWYGYSTSPWHQSGTLKKNWCGPVWGLDMYQALADSLVTINSHGEIAGKYANNVRLYEATGVGTCLLTDWKENIPDLFEPETEIVTYRSVPEFREKLGYLLAHPAECKKIGRAAQIRTLKEHTYAHRVRELIAVFKRHTKETRLHV